MINHVLFVFSVLLAGQDKATEVHPSGLVYKMKYYRITPKLCNYNSFLFSGFLDVVNFLRNVGVHITQPPLVHFSPV